MSSSPPAQMGPPYAPTTQGLGSVPTIIPDVPISAVFAFLFLVVGIAHLVIFVRNNKVAHKFKLNIPMFIFAFIRVFSAVLRIVWSTRQRNVRLAISAQVFVAAGSLILYILNLIFTQRIIRALHPRLGWSKPCNAFFGIIIAITAVSLVMVIVVSIQSFFTLSLNTQRIDRNIQLFVSTLFAVVSFLPILLIGIAYIIPRTKQIDYFGTGSFRAKVLIVVGSAILICAGASYRAGTSWLPPVPLRGPTPGYFSKAAFYGMDLLIDLIVIALWAIMRVDQRLWVPNGSKGSYYPHPERGSRYADIEKSVALADYTSRASMHTKYSTTSLVIPDRTKSMDTHAESMWTLPTTELDFDRTSGKWSLKRASDWSMGTTLNGQRMTEEWTMLGREDPSMPNRTAELQKKWGAAAAAHGQRPRTADSRPPSALATRSHAGGRPRSSTAGSAISPTGGRTRSLTGGSVLSANGGSGRPSIGDGYTSSNGTY